MDNGKLLHSITAFGHVRNRDPGVMTSMSGSYAQSLFALSQGDIIKTVISRIALDASMVEFRHNRTNSDGVTTSITSALLECLDIQANLDQTGRAFVYDLVWTMLDEGVAVIVPTEFKRTQFSTSTDDIASVRVGSVSQWYTKSVRVRVYNEETGRREELVVDKKEVAIIESPFYSVLNGDNTTLRLLNQKLSILNSQDKDQALGKINGFIKLPYQVSGSYYEDKASSRKKQIEQEMSDSRYGIATLENREEFINVGSGVNNNLLDDIMKLQQDFYNSIGITENIMNGTASPTELRLYDTRVVDPVLRAITDTLNMRFLTKTARSQGQSFNYYRDPFKLVPIETLIGLIDPVMRNSVLAPNELRPIMGFEPHPDALADKLYNRNIADANQVGGTATPGQTSAPDGSDGMSAEPETVTIYENEDGSYEDEDGHPVDQYGNPI